MILFGIYAIIEAENETRTIFRLKRVLDRKMSLPFLTSYGIIKIYNRRRRLHTNNSEKLEDLRKRLADLEKSEKTVWYSVKGILDALSKRFWFPFIFNQIGQLMMKDPAFTPEESQEDEEMDEECRKINDRIGQIVQATATFRKDLEKELGGCL